MAPVAAAIAKRVLWHDPLGRTVPVSRPASLEGSGLTPHQAKVEPPLVLLLGWWGSNDRSVAKFAKVYAERGCAVCQFIAKGSETFAPGKRCDEVAEALLDAVGAKYETNGVGDGYTSGPARVMFHIMSNNGGMLYLAVLRCAAASSRHRWATAAAKGVVYDCAPGTLTTLCFFQALLATKPPLPVRCAVLGLPLALLAALLRACRWRPLALAVAVSLLSLLWRGMECNFDERYHSALAEDPTTCPQLFMYSADDALIPRAAVEDLVERRRKRGVEVISRRWCNVAHMALLRDSPREYREVVHDFLEHISLSQS